MRIAILTDLHANRTAIEAVWEHAQLQGFDRLAILGDLVGYSCDAAWAVDWARERQLQGAIVVQGNHDAAASCDDSIQMNADASQAIVWTRQHLSIDQRQFLAQLPLRWEEGECLFVHANAWNPKGWEYIASRSDAVRSMQTTACSFTFCGHMHEPRLYHLSGVGKAGEFAPTPGIAIPVSRMRKWLIVPGACGQPRDGNPAAAYAIYDAAAQTITYHRVPYDHVSTQLAMQAAGLPKRLSERLLEGT